MTPADIYPQTFTPGSYEPLFPALQTYLNGIPVEEISSERMEILDSLAAFIQQRIDSQQPVLLNFICTHNSRRSHLAQVWAQTMASVFQIPSVFCFSSGTEETAVYPLIVDTLEKSGFSVQKINPGRNPVYHIRFAATHPAIVAFSKRIDHPDNPASDFAAVMTCTQAGESCPFVPGASVRILLEYEDPKAFDGTSIQLQQYRIRSAQIAREMRYVFSKIKINPKHANS